MSKVIQSLVFEVGGDLFAVAIEDVREVSEVLPFRAMPKSHGALLGLANLRGEVVGLVDMRILLGLTPTDTLGKEVILIFETGQGLMGVLVDRVLATAELPDVEMPSAAEGAVKETASFVSRMCSYKDRFAPMVDFSKMLTEGDWVGSPNVPKDSA